jgi:outer membrane protein TolC
VLFRSINAYYNALLNDRKEKLAKEELDIGKKDFEIVQNQHKLGLASSMALDEAQLAYDKLELKYASAVDDRDSSLDDIADLLGISREECVLAPEIIAEADLPEYSRYAFVELVKKNDTAYLNAVKDQEFKQKRYDIYMEITRYGVGEEVAEAEKELLTANMALRSATKNEIIQLYSEYVDLQNMKGDIETAKNNLKVSQDKVKQKELQYEKGLITELELRKERLNCSYAGLSLDQTINEFNLRTGNLMIKLN